MLWMILTLMTALAAVGLAIPLIRKRDAARTPRNAVVEVLKSQLGEIDAQAQAGALPTEEAEALKSDVKRRVLAEARVADAATRPLSERSLLGLALGLVAVVVLAATGLYLKMGRPEVAADRPLLGAAASGQASAGGAHPEGDVASMIVALETRMKQAPGDAEGWRMLGWSYLQVGRNADAAQAYGKAAALQPGNAQYLSALGEATVLAAQGAVTPPAQDAFRKALAADPADPRARYYLAVAKDQAGDQKGAMADWIALLKSAPADAPWAPEVRSFVEKIAHERGLDLTGQLPPAAPIAPSAGVPPTPGPTAADVAAARQLSDQGRAAMIEGMLGKLEARLKSNPRDREGWQQLMRSRMVLNQPQAAAKAYRDAEKVFAGSAADQAALRQTATGLGLPGV